MSQSRPSATRSGRQAAFGFIFASALMTSVSFGLMIPILPNLIRQLTGGDTAAASDWNVIFATTWGAMQFVVGPILGVLSDRVGRRPVLLISNFGLAVDFLFMAFAPTLWWLYLGRILNGMTAASFSTGGAYVADITRPQDRAKNFGMLTSAFSFGFILGPTLGGFLGDINIRLPFLVAAGVTGLNWFYGLLVLPESLPLERRLASFEWRRANPLGSLKLLRAHPGLLSLAGVGFLFQLAQIVLPQVFVLYTIYRYHWSMSVLGATFLITGVMGVIVQMFLVGPAVARFGERRLVLMGCAAGALGFAWYGTASNGWMYLLGAPIFAFSGFLMPGVQGLMSQRVPPSHQGQLQGVNQSLQGIASIIGPSIFGLTFAFSVRHEASLHLPGLAIYLAGGLFVLAFLLAWGFAHPHRPQVTVEPATAS
ncbi:TCR/Tet family MFS transporter [Phenylobacterium sp.]|uniref:TCR/Tet family MFS transporter n=1 Tax=Phenylobacterium sp. TaxID=1871053 RepID=UPI002E30E4EF|nr:TCR/Tet family MFS transporter [Phenylobacterium sp.]HEX3366364.1 TCR/Tet family MFS transporter [Phenylobacterium sp.]